LSISLSENNTFYGTLISGYAPSNSILKVTAMGSAFSPAVDALTGSWSVDLLSTPNLYGSRLSASDNPSFSVGASLLDAAGNESSAIYRRIVLHENHLPTGNITIASYTGGYLPGGTLIAQSNLVDVDGMDSAEITYRWQADGVDVVGAQSWRYYQIRDQDIGTRISAVATYTDYYRNVESVNTSQSELIRAPNHYHSGSIAIINFSDL
jgi:hypothetical protein